ncbi:MAG: hypothetical protein WBA46_01785 [Thermomicrobiales bacterium]
MPQDHNVYVELIADEWEGYPNVFRTVVVDGNGKRRYSKLYSTQNDDTLHMYDRTIDGDAWRTRAECNEIARKIRHDLAAVALP